MERLRLGIFMAIFFAVVCCGALGFMYVEGLSMADAVYYTVVTISTVGYGDIHPLTPMGKFLAILVIVCGGGTFFGILESATELFLKKRERQTRIMKLNIIVGVFFKEIGTALLQRFMEADSTMENLRKHLLITTEWHDRQYKKAKRFLAKYPYNLSIHAIGLNESLSFLNDHTDLLLRLLENPNLLEHESFTDLLQSVLHIKAELEHRPSFEGLPESDYKHLAGDFVRAYSFLVFEWLNYMQYLGDNYPYLYSLAIRTNPFDNSSSPIVKG